MQHADLARDRPTCLRQADDVDPRTPGPAWLHAGQAGAARRQLFLSDAATFYRSIIEKRKDSPFRGKALFAAGQILNKRLRKPEEAAVYFQQLLQQPHVVDWGHLAQAELGTGNSGDSV